MANFKIGDKAYFEESWTENIIGGKVIEVGMTEETEKHPSEQFVKIQIEGSRYEKRDQLSSKCYPTCEAETVIFSVKIVSYVSSVPSGKIHLSKI